MSAKYCAQCGASLYSNAAFCSQCGRPVQAQPAVSQPPPAAYPAAPQAPPPPAAYPAAPQTAPQAPSQPATYTAEPILDVLSALQRKKGMLGMRSEAFNLILTPVRLVFVTVSSQEMREAVNQARTEAKAQGKGWFGQVAAQMAWTNVIAERYRSMPVDAVLAQHPGSFYVLNNQVTRIRFNEVGSDDDTTQRIQMTVESAGGKHRFDVTNVPGDAVNKRLRQVLPHAVR